MGKAAARRHQRVCIFGRYFDKIAKYAIVANLQRGDPGRCPVARFHRGDGGTAIAPSNAQGIKRGIITFRNIAALGRFGWRRCNQRPLQKIDHRAMAIQCRQQCFQHGRPVGHGAKPFAQNARAIQAITDLSQIAG